MDIDASATGTTAAVTVLHHLDHLANLPNLGLHQASYTHLLLAVLPYTQSSNKKRRIEDRRIDVYLPSVYIGYLDPTGSGSYRGSYFIVTAVF